jgi:transcriptional regulator with XRE-family HTH domain
MRQIQDIFVENLKWFRKQKKLTQAQLAERADVSTALIAEIETKKRNPTLTTIGRIALGLEIQPQLLFVDKEANTLEQSRTQREELRMLLHDSVDKMLGE